MPLAHEPTNIPDLEARIAYYAARAERGEPLFDATTPFELAKLGFRWEPDAKRWERPGYELRRLTATSYQLRRAGEQGSRLIAPRARDQAEALAAAAREVARVIEADLEALPAAYGPEVA